MFCSHCGTNNRDEANFCKKCGQKLIQPKVKPPVRKTGPALDFSVKEKDQTETNASNESPSGNKEVEPTSKNKKYETIGSILLVAVVILSPFAYSYAKYFSTSNSAEHTFASGNYTDAVAKLKSINQHGLYKSVKNKLNQQIDLYNKIVDDDSNFQQAKKEEQNNNLDKAKEILDSINSNYPHYSDVEKESVIVNGKITDKAKSDVAAAQAQADKAASDKKAAQAAAAKAAASAAANKAAADAAQQAAAQQAAQAQAAAAAAAAAQQAEAQAIAIAKQQAQAQDTAYVTALAKASSFFNQANTYINDSASAYSSGNYSAATADALTAETSCLAGLAALPSSYPIKFQTVNNDAINALNYLNTSAKDLFYFEENTDVNMLNSAASFQTQAISYYNQISTDLSAVPN